MKVYLNECLHDKNGLAVEGSEDKECQAEAIVSVGSPSQ